MNMNPTSSSKHGLVLFSLLFLLPLSSGQEGQSAPDRYDAYAQATFTPSMAIIIVILVAALFFMGFFSIYIRHCSTSDSSNAVRPFNGSQRNRRAAARGLDTAVIQTFPTLVYSEVKVLKIGKGALECAVCLCEFEDDETLRLIPKCDHVFHPECIDAWLAAHTTCPVCRANLNQESVGIAGETEVSPEELESGSSESDIESQNGNEQQSGRPADGGMEIHPHQGQAPESQVVIDLTSHSLNRNRTRGSSRSNRPRKLPRSHSTGHQPGENTERFTLRLPVDVRKEIIKRELNRANSLVLPRESSSRPGYRSGGEGSSRGKNSRWLERLDRSFKSDRWAFRGSFSLRGSSLRSPKVAAGNELPAQPSGPESSVAEPGRPPV